ncbi:D-3-phosphoglycerate dehydrogenase [Clostridium polyendosporum]|uniref:D-3-phosphoglycerate dehydrogenase n=1 Tax=Clostridium polyendosporum TaxID=69208 RepID=A0A919VM84_9CLOT|nr:D-2-hydroxyacid dehydrogenase [Clostridium polyendosporum]GIM29328.1 D-3-phosphoglycerate dehydrogenase [Clostridium polyendosporum]
MYKILVTDGLEKEAIEKLRDLNFEVVEQYYSQEELGVILRDFDVVVIRSATKIKKDVIDKARTEGRLKLIIRGGVGVDNIDVAYALENGIQVMNTPNASSSSVAELALGHMFALARFINISNVTMRKGEWNKKKYKGIELNGKTLGVIGMGRIGRELSKKASALGMKVIYFDGLGAINDLNQYEYRKFEELLKESDFISIHVPYDELTGSLIGSKELSIMKDGSYIINCSRGKVVDENALLEALSGGKLAGAGIDVFEEEPTHNDKLLNHPRVSVTPHIGAATKEAQERIGAEVVSLINDFFKLSHE